MGCGRKYIFIIGSFKRERKCRVNRKMDNLRGVGFEIDFIFNIDGVYVRKIWVIFFFMSCERESVYTRFVGSVKCKRHVFNVKSFNIFSEDGGAKNVVFNIRYCKRNNKGTSVSMKRGMKGE